MTLMMMTMALNAWDDHPDRDEDRRNEGADSNCHVNDEGYDWGKFDRGNDRDDEHSRGSRGTIDSSRDSKD